MRHSTWTCLPGDDSPSNSRTCSGAAEPVPWIGADEHDPRCVYNLTVTDPPNAESPVAANCTVGGVGWNMCDAPAQLYNLDVFAHESVLVGLFAVFRGFYDGGGFQRTSGELNSIYLGFSRDGFTWHRPLPRKPFLEQSWPEHSWRNNDVQSVAALSCSTIRCTSTRPGTPVCLRTLKALAATAAWVSQRSGAIASSAWWR